MSQSARTASARQPWACRRPAVCRLLTQNLPGQPSCHRLDVRSLTKWRVIQTIRDCPGNQPYKLISRYPKQPFVLQTANIPAPTRGSSFGCLRFAVRTHSTSPLRDDRHPLNMVARGEIAPPTRGLPDAPVPSLGQPKKPYYSDFHGFTFDASCPRLGSVGPGWLCFGCAPTSPHRITTVV